MDRPSVAELAALRRCVFGVAVLHDLDLEPGLHGVTLHGAQPLDFSWQQVHIALGGHAPESATGRRRVAELIRLRWMAQVLPPGLLRAAVTVVGCPADAPMHPGPDWPVLRVPGDSLHLGVAVAGLGGHAIGTDGPRATGDGSAAGPVPVSVEALEAVGIAVPSRWTELLGHLEAAGRTAGRAAAAAAAGAETPAGHRRRPAGATLRPSGGFDVVTLLGSASLRLALTQDSGGMAGLVVPMRTRGWVASSLLDPAFGPAAFRITEPEDRGFARPLLVTADEVSQVVAGGDPARHLFER